MFINCGEIDLYDFERLSGLAQKFAGGAERYAHVRGTVEKCGAMADMLRLTGELKKDILAAAYLHDITKNFTPDQHFAVCEKYNFSLSADDRETRAVLHALTGALVAKYEFGAGETIFRCVKNHTTGSADGRFSLPEKVVFLADYIEDTREYPDCALVREYFYSEAAKADCTDQIKTALDKAVIRSLELTLRRLRHTKSKIHGDTLLCLNNLIEERKRGVQ